MMTFRYNAQTKGMEYCITDDRNGNVITDWSPIQWHECGEQAQFFAWRCMGQPGDDIRVA